MVALPIADRLRATWFDAWGGPYSGVLWELMDWDNLLRADMTAGPAANISTSVSTYVSFLHVTFQQFLVAAYLLKRFEEAGEGAPEIQSLADGLILQPEWLEVLRLWGDHAHVHPGSGASALLKALLLPAVRGAQPLPGHLVVILGELHAVGIQLFAAESAAGNIPAQLLEVMQEPAASARVRVYSGRVLGALGDPRAAVMDADAIDFVEIAAGPFTLGGDHSGVTGAEVEDLALQTSHLPTYWVGRMLVTNAQYALFLQEGYDNPAYWPEAVALGLWRAGQVLRAEPVPTSEGHLLYRAVWTHSPHALRWPFDLPNHPATGVNWFEARAFARWLDARRRTVGIGMTGYHIDLPNELEWEKAARGSDGRVYPWGNQFIEDRLNWMEQLLHGPSAVGCYPDGAGPYGLLDMAGNMMEWTRTVYQPYDLQGRVVAEAESRMVLRGGGYYSPMSACRCAARSAAEAIGRLACSFRVALVPD